MSSAQQQKTGPRCADPALTRRQRGRRRVCREVNEKIALDGADGHNDPRFVSVRSTAAVVLHNVAVEMLLLSEVPFFGAWPGSRFWGCRALFLFERRC